MRKLYLLRGAPASGKSTFIEKHGLQPYTLSPDVIRLMFRSPILKLDGEFGIDQEVNAPTWKLMFEILEKRMFFGETTFIDATHSKMSDISQYKKLAEKHRYSLVVIDFSDVPLEELILRNSKREHYKVVPTAVIERMYANLQNPLSNWVRVLKPEEYFGGDNVLDFSAYKKIHHFGDIHGCWAVVQQYFDKYPIQGDELYIFTGDYVDRGIENHLVMKNLMEMAERKNFIFIEGNHEIHLWNWANDFDVKSPEFREATVPQLEKNGIDKKDVRVFCRKLREFVFYFFNGRHIFVNHAGISNGATKFPYPLMSSRAFIYGIGGYGEDIDAIFTKNTNTEYYQIHGHRNKEYPILASEKSFNLEGKVEFGGYLRVLTLNTAGFEGIELPNHVYSKEQRNRNTSLKLESATLVEQLRNNPMIQEKHQGYGISSFNFKREVFFDKLWNTQTVKARGLFIDTETNAVVARSYDKFFNYNEMLATTPASLKENLKFPVDAFIKDNGFLGIAGYSKRHQELLTASKSTLKGIFAQYFRDILAAKYNTAFLEKYAKENDVSLIFEVIDVVNDPHIIRYPESKIILLDVVENKIDFKSVLQPGIAEKIGCEDKSFFRRFNNWQELQDFFAEEANGFVMIEGFVFEDTANFKFKYKCPFYNFWKKVRNIRDRLRTNINDACHDELYLEVYTKLKENPDFLNLSIPELRKVLGYVIIDLNDERLRI